MHSDSTYLVSALEDYGTSTYEKLYEVTPGDSYLRPFTDFLIEKVGNKVPGEWPEKDNPQVITNIDNLQGGRTDHRGIELHTKRTERHRTRPRSIHRHLFR